MTTKLLHTADWHVGKGIKGRSRADEHRAVLREIASLAEGHDVDIVLVAGDVFDHASPTAEAEKIVYDAIVDLADTGAEVVVIAGNHDHPRRLEAIRPVFERAVGVHIVPDLETIGTTTVRLTGATGEPVDIACLPYLSRRRLHRLEELMSLGPRELGRRWADTLATVIDRLAAETRPNAVRICLGHLTVAGGRLGGGERLARLGFDDAVPVEAFEGRFDFVALGHLHRTQQFGRETAIWYSGSPLALDFGDDDPRRYVLMVEAERGAPARVESIELTTGTPLTTVRGDLDTLAGLDLDAGEAGHLRVLVDEAPRPGLGDDVRQLFPTAVEIRVAMDTKNEPPTAPQPIEAFLERAPTELFGEFLRERGVDGEALEARFRELLRLRTEIRDG